jgi:phosphoglycerate kinase
VGGESIRRSLDDFGKRRYDRVMTVTPESLIPWCRTLLGLDPSAPKLTLPQYLDAIPRVESLTDVPSGTPVLVRGDVDAKPGERIGDGDIRLRSMVDTLSFGRQRGWKQVVFGHIGRKADGTLGKVARRLGELLGCEVPLVPDWMDNSAATIHDSAAATIRAAAPGAVIMLENTRKYDLERALWDATEADLAKLAVPLSKLANQFAEKIARVYVNEALSAGSLDTSTLIVPAAMDRAVLGNYVAGEFTGPMMRCMAAELVVFSGLKADKLDDLEAIIDRGQARWVFAAGSLAMALKKAVAELDGGSFCMGVAEHPDHKDKPYFVSPERVDQAKRMVANARRNGIQIVLPVDFILGDGRVAESIGPTEQQFDVGPKSTQHFVKKIGEFLSQVGPAGPAGPGAPKPAPVASPPPARDTPPVAFHNGVFGMFEDPRFESGTRDFMPQLKRMKDAGVEVYIGGGEGGAALEKYGQPDWVTHTFTAGGTVLNALGSQPVPYLVALRMANRRDTK